MNIDKIARMFSEDDSDEEETSRKSSSEESQYQFEGFTIEFSSKVALLPATK